MNHLTKTVLLLLISSTGFCQVVHPVKPPAFTGKKQLNEVEDKDAGLVSNATYPDNVLTKQYERYRSDSLRYVNDSLQRVRSLQPAIKPTKNNKG